MQFDTESAFGLRVLRRLRNEQIIWLTTTSDDGTPQPSPVWFLWDDATFLIYSRPDTPKIRHISARPEVALNFDSDGRGGDIVVITGTAAVVPDAPPSTSVAPYQMKYAAGIKGINMTPESFAAAYSAAIRVVPVKIRGH